MGVVTLSFANYDVHFQRVLCYTCSRHLLVLPEADRLIRRRVISCLVVYGPSDPHASSTTTGKLSKTTSLSS